MNIQDCLKVIGYLSENFDSHDFILKLLEKFPSHYGELLVKYKNVNEAHAEIGRFLLKYSEDLEIEKTGEDYSPNIFRNISPCAKWHKK